VARRWTGGKAGRREGGSHCEAQSAEAIPLTATSFEHEGVTALLFIRAITYAALFIGFLLVFLPARVLSWSGIERPATIGVAQVAGMLVGAAGAALALWCIATFVVVGRGTPAPFDPPRRLVVVGPYRWVRNPMYLGAGLALAGAALFYQSWPLLGYTGAFLLVMYLFVVFYEEPALRASFGTPYLQYCKRVRRWWPWAPPSGAD
jgi:protein-S-isoprenylcysteine O-methyltransferase Ste14